jgi:hypothetical protein
MLPDDELAAFPQPPLVTERLYETLSDNTGSGPSIELAKS